MSVISRATKATSPNNSQSKIHKDSRFLVGPRAMVAEDDCWLHGDHAKENFHDDRY